MSFIILFSCFNMWADQNQSGPSNAVNMANPILSGNVLLNPFKLDHQFLAQVFGTEICPGTSMAQADGTIANYFFPPAQDQQNVLAIRDPRRTLQDGDVIVFNSDPDATVYRRQYGIFSGEFPHAAIVQVRDGKILLVESPFPELEKAAPTSTEIQNVMNAKEALAQSQFISQLRSANAYPKEDIQAFIQLQEERRNHPRNGPPPTGPSGQNPTTKRSEGFRQIMSSFGNHMRQTMSEFAPLAGQEVINARSSYTEEQKNAVIQELMEIRTQEFLEHESFDVLRVRSDQPNRDQFMQRMSNHIENLKHARPEYSVMEDRTFWHDGNDPECYDPQVVARLQSDAAAGACVGTYCSGIPHQCLIVGGASQRIESSHLSTLLDHYVGEIKRMVSEKEKYVTPERLNLEIENSLEKLSLQLGYMAHLVENPNRPGNDSANTTQAAQTPSIFNQLFSQLQQLGSSAENLLESEGRSDAVKNMMEVLLPELIKTYATLDPSTKARLDEYYEQTYGPLVTPKNLRDNIYRGPEEGGILSYVGSVNHPDCPRQAPPAQNEDGQNEQNRNFNPPPGNRPPENTPEEAGRHR